MHLAWQTDQQMPVVHLCNNSQTIYLRVDSQHINVSVPQCVGQDSEPLFFITTLSLAIEDYIHLSVGGGFRKWLKLLWAASCSLNQ